MTALQIIVPAELILDGAADIPKVGDRVDYAIQFYLSGWYEQCLPPEYSNDVVVRVEQLNSGRPAPAWTDPYGQPHPKTYPMLLHGDGWCAYFSSPHLEHGMVQLTGSFEADWPGVIPSEAMVAGTVTDRQLITRTSSPDADGRHTQGWVDSLGTMGEGQTGFQSGLVPAVPIPSD
ncbi:hypothetical protein GS490_15620 [Rhodococcus hoagii]|nr:hypothetical protein [Prescottella equi]